MVAIINTSKTYNFNPPLGELIINAFGRVQVKPTEITQQHMYNARISSNLVLAEFSNLQPNLWEVGLNTVPILANTATYTVPAETVMILDMYLSYGSPSTDRYIPPISRTEYSAYPNKTQVGVPNVFWFDRLISPTFTLWPVPDGNGPYTINYYSVRQTQDAVVTGGKTVEAPDPFLDAFCSALAWRLAEMYAPQLEDKLFIRMDRAWKIAATQDTENVPLYITPMMGGYWTS